MKLNKELTRDLYLNLGIEREKMRRKKLKKARALPYNYDNILFKGDYSAQLIYSCIVWPDGSESVMSETLVKYGTNLLIEGDIIEEFNDRLYIISKVYNFKGNLMLVELFHTKHPGRHSNMLKAVTS